ncbi:MAG: hypothetical protein KGO46_05045, partial [Bacteroidetes bacterium]|nr:hypothetical protein [Bacteroidota bacterium]
MTALHPLFLTPFFKAAPQKAFHPKKSYLSKRINQKLTAMRIFIALLFLATTTLHAQVGIGTTNPNTAAALDVFSTSKALLLPRLTTTQRDNSIASPVSGMVIYNTTEHKFQGYAGTASSTTLAQSTVGGTFDYASSNEYPAQ